MCACFVSRRQKTCMETGAVGMARPYGCMGMHVGVDESAVLSWGLSFRVLWFWSEAWFCAELWWAGTCMLMMTFR